MLVANVSLDCGWSKHPAAKCRLINILIWLKAVYFHGDCQELFILQLKTGPEEYVSVLYDI